MTRARICAMPACERETGRRYANYCDACRWRTRGKPSTHRLTPEREAYMRAHYRPSERGVSIRIARVLGVPKWRVCRWAGELGLTGPRTIGVPWTPAEDAVLEQSLGTRHPNWIARKLGRSVTAVVVRAKRLALSRRDARGWFTARQVADGMGVDGGTVSRWIEKGWLRARHEGQDWPSGRPAAWRVETRDLKRFLREYPTAYMLAKVDQVWFLDLVFDGFGTREQAA